MGRNNKGLKYEIHQLINAQLMIGQKKVKNKKNPNLSDGIHSCKTANSYRSAANVFGNWLKNQGIKKISDIKNNHFEQYFKMRNASNSAYTLAHDVSALNKIFGTHYTVSGLGLKKRNYRNITNNRGYTNSRTINAMNKPKIDLIQACGIRRQSVGKITPDQAIRDSNGTVFGFIVTEKGGKKRNCVVLQGKQAFITALVNAKIQEYGTGRPMFPEGIDKNIGTHIYRAAYATKLYNDLKRAKEDGKDYYCGYREIFINENKMHRAMERYKSDTVKGFDKECLAEVSQNLGHNRLDVVIYHYVGKDL